MPAPAPVSTMTLCPAAVSSATDGGVSPIVHQYDRHPALMAAMHERWGQGFEARERRRGKSLSERGRKLKESLARRLPELR